MSEKIDCLVCTHQNECAVVVDDHWFDDVLATMQSYKERKRHFVPDLCELNFQVSRCKDFEDEYGGMPDLTKVERVRLKEMLDIFEARVYRNEGWKHHSGGFATCEFEEVEEDYYEGEGEDEEDFVFFKVEHGVISECEHKVYTDRYKLKRSVLQDEKLDVDARLKLIKEA